jgi:DNA-directed RNA polymerase sigma subunit (sigma70/sigma32)
MTDTAGSCTEEGILVAVAQEGDLEPLAPPAAAPQEGTVRRIDEMLRQVLDQQELRLLTLRFGLDGREPLAADAAGAELGLSRQQVERLQERALAKLRRPMGRPAISSPLN